MFFGMCIYETLSEDGRLESIIITPAKDGDGVLLTDFRRDVGPAIGDAVDVGPLRFYTEEHGLAVRTAKSRLRGACFEQSQSGLTFQIDHLHWPLRPSHAGYYILLLPAGYTGHARSNGERIATTYLSDTNQLLVHHFVHPDAPSLRIAGGLIRGASPPDGAAVSNSIAVFSGDLPGVHYTPVSNLLRAMKRNPASAKASAFICHSSGDKEQARRLAIELAMRDVQPWIDEAEIRVGDSLIEKIEHGIQSTTCLVPLLSRNSVSSRWCREELKMALASQIKSGIKGVLPALIDECEIPGFLIEKAYADLRHWDKYDRAVDALANDIRYAATQG